MGAHYDRRACSAMQLAGQHVRGLTDLKLVHYGSRDLGRLPQTTWLITPTKGAAAVGGGGSGCGGGCGAGGRGRGECDDWCGGGTGSTSDRERERTSSGTLDSARSSTTPRRTSRKYRRPSTIFDTLRHRIFSSQNAARSDVSSYPSRLARHALAAAATPG